MSSEQVQIEDAVAENTSPTIALWRREFAAWFREEHGREPIMSSVDDPLAWTLYCAFLEGITLAARIQAGSVT